MSVGAQMFCPRCDAEIDLRVLTTEKVKCPACRRTFRLPEVITDASELRMAHSVARSWSSLDALNDTDALERLCAKLARHDKAAEQLGAAMRRKTKKEMG